MDCVILEGSFFNWLAIIVEIFFVTGCSMVVCHTEGVHFCFYEVVYDDYIGGQYKLTLANVRSHQKLIVIAFLDLRNKQIFL